MSCPGARRIVYGVLSAFPDAVHTGHAAAVIDCVVFGVDTRGFAVAGARLTAVAFVGVDYRAEERESRQKSQYGAYGANGVAIGTSVAPSQYDDDYQCGDGDEESGKAFEPYLGRVEGVAVDMLGYGCEQVVAPSVNGCEQVGGDAAVGAVWLDERSPRG